MNKKFLLMLLAAVLTISFAAVSFAAPSDGGVKDDSMSKPGADKWDEGKPGKPDAKVQTTGGKTYPPGDGGIKDDSMGKPGADKR